MSRSVYLWKPGAKFSGSAQVVGETLSRLRDEHEGRLLPEHVISEATPQAHPLHRYFEWDQKRAARKYRLEQARHLIKSVEIVVSGRRDPIPVRAFVSIVSPTDGGNHFVPTIVALSDREMRRQVLGEALADLEALRRKYGGLLELAEVFSAVDRLRPAA